MDGWWDCRQPDEFICRVLKSRLDVALKGGLKYLPLLLPGILFNLQSKARAHIVAKRHYDFDNDLFLSSFLYFYFNTAALTSTTPPTCMCRAEKAYLTGGKQLSGG